MATEIRRVQDGRVVAIGANAIRDGDQYLITLLFAGPGGGITRRDLRQVFHVRDSGIFFGKGTRLELSDLRTGDPEMAVFCPLDPRAANGSST